MARKLCNKCNVIKSINDFNKSTRIEYMSIFENCVVEQVREWTANNKARVNERERNWHVNNTQRRINTNVHVKINGVLRHGKYSERLEQIIGLSQVQFLEWISFNFKNNMCWSNYATMWQFDLLIPASLFDLTNEQQLLCCYNWSNLWPCLKSENAVEVNFILIEEIVAQKIKAQEFIFKMRQLNIQFLI